LCCVFVKDSMFRFDESGYANAPLSTQFFKNKVIRIRGNKIHVSENGSKTSVWNWLSLSAAQLDYFNKEVVVHGRDMSKTYYVITPM